MKGTKKNQVIRHCAHCGRKFEVNPRLGRRHRFCSQPECAHASHLKSDRKWRCSPKGLEYFKGWVNAEHVRTWRKEYPGYWRRNGKLSGITLDKSLVAVLREFALQDSIDTHLALLVGLVAKVSNLALQDTIAFELRQIMLRGHGILQNSESSVNPAAPAAKPRARIRKA